MISLKSENLTSRPPIVVVVGHIDHGKTRLLDYIRNTNVIEKESGGITQHVGAYEVVASTKDGSSGKITFLDTPGHEAFSKIRVRGASIADVAILVVAADEGVKAQTEESIKALHDAKIPFVVAINKIDKEAANPERVKNELAEKQVFVEGHGGDVPVVEISAKLGDGVDTLLETVLLVAEMEELIGDHSLNASGVVVESSLDPKRGNSATMIIQNGTLKSGEFILVGSVLAPVRIFEDFLGHSLKEATFSSPVRIVGFNALPEVGATFQSFASKKEADVALKASVEDVVLEKKEIKTTPRDLPGGRQKVVIRLLLKADVAGSLEALESEIKKLSSDKIEIKILRSGVGGVSEDDLKLLLSAKDSILVSFRAGIGKNIVEALKSAEIIFNSFDIIYEIADWLKPEIEKRLPQEIEITEEGRVKILKVFKETGKKRVIGGRVIDKFIRDGAKLRVLRNNNQIGTGYVLELQHGKAKVKEVEKDQEFGVLVESDVSISPGDVLEIFTENIIKARL